MKKIVFNHKGQFTHLFLSFSEQVVKSHNLLMGIGTPVEFELRLSLGDRHIMVNDRVGLAGFQRLFLAQRTLLLEALKVIEEDQDLYKRYELLKSCRAEYEVVKLLLINNRDEPVRDFKRFCDEQFVPILDNHIVRVDECLKIKHHKSYVHKSIADKGLLRLDGLIGDDELSDIFAFFERSCLDKKEYYALMQELRYGRPSVFEYYRLTGISTNTIPLFFKILRERYQLSMSNRDMARWLHRKFRVERKGELFPLNSERTIEDKLKGPLTRREKSLKLDASFDV